MAENIDRAMEDPDLIMVVEVGSTAHGTGLPGGEDFDMIGVKIETPAEVFGVENSAKSVMHRTQPEGTRSGPGDIDLTVHSLRRFLYLAATGNPSILMCLWSPEIKLTPLGLELRKLAPAFVGRHVIPRFRGYMHSQTMRLLGVGGGKHGKRGGGQRPELISAHGYDTKYAMHAARLGFQCVELLENGYLTYPIPGIAGDWLRRVRLGEVPFEEWWAVALAVDVQCERLMHEESLDIEPDTRAITRWSQDAHQLHWKNRGLNTLRTGAW